MAQKGLMMMNLFIANSAMFLFKQECGEVGGHYQEQFVNCFKFIWSGKFYICQGKVREFQNPVAVATMLMIDYLQALITTLLFPATTHQPCISHLAHNLPTHSQC